MSFVCGAPKTVMLTRVDIQSSIRASQLEVSRNQYHHIRVSVCLDLAKIP